MRNLVIAVVSAGVGLAAGALVMQARGGAVEAEALKARERLEQEVARLERELVRAASKTAAPEPQPEPEAASVDVSAWEARIAELEGQLADRTAQIGELTALVEWLEAEAAAPQAVPAEADAADEDDEERRRRWPGGEVDEATRAEWEARRRMMAETMRDRVHTFMDGEIQKAGDPAAQQRLAAIDEYAAYMMDLAGQMRQAESDEQRDAVRSEMDAARGDMRQLVGEQRQHMLREVAEANGIKGVEQQDAFVASMREVLSSPFFRSEQELFGRGGPGFRGMGGPPGYRGRRPE